LVDADRLGARLDRLEVVLPELDAVRAAGVDAYLANGDTRAATERRLQLAIQLCIDIGAQLASELGVRAPSDYAQVFSNLADAGHLDDELAQRLANAARLRNILVHLYLDIDDREVFGALQNLDDLREFARIVQGLADDF
jgi:uncharacterized protein YutE (UPF0331/DUF86 family)